MSEFMAFLSGLDIDGSTVVLSVSALIAIWAIHRNQVVNRRRATVDFVMRERDSKKLWAARDVVSGLLENGELESYATTEHLKSDEGKAILELLNHREFIASGIRENALDFKLYHRMQRGIVVKEWGQLKGFVANIRKNDQRGNTLFQEFEWLADKFKNKPLKKNNKSQ